MNKEDISLIERMLKRISDLNDDNAMFAYNHFAGWVDANTKEIDKIISDIREILNAYKGE